MSDITPPVPPAESQPVSPAVVPAPLAPPGAAVPVGSLGNIGTARSAGLIILLTIVTLGVWAVVWSYQNGEELKRHARTGIGGVGYLLLTFFISPVTMFLMAGEVEQLYRRKGRQPPITTVWGLWFLLPLIGNLIWYLRIQRAINDYWAAEGSTVKPGI
jgi:cbb3-type cytochrome oxidase subunit 3